MLLLVGPVVIVILAYLIMVMRKVVIGGHLKPNVPVTPNSEVMLTTLVMARLNCLM